MRLVVAICAALLVAIGSASHADAQPSAKRKGKKQAAPSANYSTAGGFQGSARGAALRAPAGILTTPASCLSAASSGGTRRRGKAEAIITSVLTV